MHHIKDMLGGKHEQGTTYFVTAERAEGLRDKDGIGKSDPYCKIKFGNKTHETKHKKNEIYLQCGMKHLNLTQILMN